ncbi:MAG: Fic family protein [Bacteroidetes bacterium]|nr:Fic family protein [Bacteroidota bacterium]
MKSKRFLQEITVFNGRQAPEKGYIVGYGSIIKVLNLPVPKPKKLALISKKKRQYETEEWLVFTPRHQPKDTLYKHLVFALKYEGIDLLFFKILFQKLKKRDIETLITITPQGQYSRKIWFLYEWLMDEKLNVPDLKAGTYVEIVNPKLQYPGPVRNSTRHRVKNNLPGTPEFCPMIRKTEKIETFIEKDLSGTIEKGLNKRDKELVRRAAAFLLLKDSKASFAIEGEYPLNLRARNWGKVIGQAGKNPLTLKEFERLQDTIIGPRKLKNMGLRKDEGFIGEHDRETFSPIPDHISAKAKDLPSLMNGLIETDKLFQEANYDPVLVAAVISFGFVFIHPLSDGNGRIHRYIIHHILAKSGYAKREMIFPVSAAILNRISDYQEILEVYSSPRLDLIEWKETPDHNVQILNETIDLYRYYDLTEQAEFLYECVEDTIKRIIPEELDYLEKYDRMNQFINNHLTLPDNKVDLLIKFLNQNEGKLSMKKRQKEFDELTDDETNNIEKAYSEIFGND